MGRLIALSADVEAAANARNSEVVIAAFEEHNRPREHNPGFCFYDDGVFYENPKDCYCDECVSIGSGFE